MSKGPSTLSRTLIAMIVSAVMLLAQAPSVSAQDRKPSPAVAPGASGVLDPFFGELQERTFRFFWETGNPQNGLIPDRYPTPSFSSIAAVGFGLTTYPVGVERGYITRPQARQRVLATLRFLAAAPQGAEARGVAGYRGFFYHFLDMKTGERFEDSELSTVDTAILLAGALFCQSYFDGADPEEVEIRALADDASTGAWTGSGRSRRGPPSRWAGRPRKASSRYDWRGYNEAMLVYLLALGSPTFPVGADAWGEWTSTYDKQWGTTFGQELPGLPAAVRPPVHATCGPTSATSATRTCSSAASTTSRTAGARSTRSRRTPSRTRAVPGLRSHRLGHHGQRRAGRPRGGGRRRAPRVSQLHGARHRSHRQDRRLHARADRGRWRRCRSRRSWPSRRSSTCTDASAEHIYSKYGFLDAFNPTFVFDVPLRHGRYVPGFGWVAGDYLGIDQGAMLAMIENYRSALVWRVMRKNPYLRRGLERAGFSGGWLGAWR